MVARTYDKLGGISGVQTNNDAPYSLRGVDRDRFQNFMFECDPDYPFSGTVLIEISQDDPSRLTRNAVGKLKPDTSDFSWSAVAKLVFAGERDDIFVELQIEAAHIRVRCTSHDANASVSSSSGGVVGGTGPSTFTIDGNPVVVNPADDLNAVVNAITLAAIPNISAAIDPKSQTLVITKAGGTTMALVDTVGTALQDIGVLRGDDGGAYTANPNGRIKQVKSMR